MGCPGDVCVKSVVVLRGGFVKLMRLVLGLYASWGHSFGGQTNSNAGASTSLSMTISCKKGNGKGEKQILRSAKDDNLGG
jgi:hypothetical protein